MLDGEEKKLDDDKVGEDVVACLEWGKSRNAPTARYGSTAILGLPRGSAKSV